MKTRICGIVVLIATISALLLRPAASQQDRNDLENRVENTVREYGVIESAKTVRLVNQLPEEMTLLSILPEGTAVKKGDLVVELDDSELVDLENQAQIEVRLAQEALQRASLESRGAKMLAQNLTDLNGQKIKVAQLNQTRHLSENGMLAVSLRDARREAEVAQARLDALTNRINRLRQVQPAAVDEMESLEYDAKQAREESAKAQDQVQFLNTIEIPYQTAVLDLAVSQAKAEQVQQDFQAQSAVLQAESQIGTARSDLERAEAEVDYIKEQRAKCRITAPTDGFVAYIAPAGRTAAPVAVGAAIAAGQPLLEISDLTQYRVRARVHESRIHRVKAGQSVRIKLDAIPNQTFEGKVLSVNNTPEPLSWFSETARSYAVLISIDAPADRLRLGLTALVEIDAP